MNNAEAGLALMEVMRRRLEAMQPTDNIFCGFSNTTAGCSMRGTIDTRRRYVILSKARPIIAGERTGIGFDRKPSGLVEEPKRFFPMLDDGRAPLLNYGI